MKLSIHCKEHRSFSCDICYTGFVSEPLLVEHHLNDHPQGRPAWSASREDPDTGKMIEKAMEVIRTPDPDPFIDKGHPAIGHVKRDEKHRVECEVCHRYLKTFKLQVEHVKTFHPTVFYDCVFCPGAVFYTIQDLLSHCKEKSPCMPPMPQPTQGPGSAKTTHGHQTPGAASTSRSGRCTQRLCMW